MDPDKSLHSIETALRLATFIMLPDWERANGAPDLGRLADRQREEAARRDGVTVSSSLLDYTMTTELTKLVLSNWETYKPIFADMARTKVYFGILEDVRNAIAHGRELVPYEQNLLEGIAGQIRNQVSAYRTENDPSALHYPLIERVTDNFGRDGFSHDKPRLNVGDELKFSASAFGVGGRENRWRLRWSNSRSRLEESEEVARGNDVSIAMIIDECHVSESLSVVISLCTASTFTRHSDSIEGNYDDHRQFEYSVNPPA